ncbi:related to PMI40 - mannose-6-phosphate isomerase [Pseudozyma flocculosa]|uniref:Mannose-6-phosphate isomerase n=1 Tax=Pseudozyma flocculosa TaxID=84751 RepID=A0A5C3F8U2_9BASI|nr:related to PMI40 - mannose-6-phosphate isomerase [Pseudozyma flocculosa]
MASEYSTAPVFQIVPGVQCYDWGIKGSTSRVAQYALATHQLNFQPSDDKPCAELWMGTHPSLPSRLVSPASSSSSSAGSDEAPTLSSHLEAHPDLIGDAVARKFSDEEPGCLPFLFKVLSVGKALSIQAHPDKKLGKRLHQQRPDVYKDPNHKPEMAIALTPFSGFCGFRPLAEIGGFIDTVPEFAQLCSLGQSQLEELHDLIQSEADASSASVKSMLRTIFSNLMRAPASTYEALCDATSRRFSSSSSAGVPQEERALLLKLNEQYPHDIGIFCTFLLNINRLEAGQAMFLQANEPHAYLEGEILECMAASDNVVRAGLTPKLRDVDTLIDMCTYTSGKALGMLDATDWKCKRDGGDGEAKLFSPPIDEFDLVVSSLPRGGKQEQGAVQGPSILLGLEGQDQDARWARAFVQP